jgi:hypothetical protein
VIGVADELQDLPPASTDALALAVAVDEDDEDEEAELLPLLLQAASGKMATAPAAAIILRVLGNILVKLLCSVLPCFVCGAAVLIEPPSAAGPRPRGVGSATMTSGC